VGFDPWHSAVLAIRVIDPTRRGSDRHSPRTLILCPCSDHGCPLNFRRKLIGQKLFDPVNRSRRIDRLYWVGSPSFQSYFGSVFRSQMQPFRCYFHPSSLATVKASYSCYSRIPFSFTYGGITLFASTFQSTSVLKTASYTL
jgi:hypothetical protein